MSYREHSPSPWLRPWIECYWSTQPVASRTILPDGCSDLIFELHPKSLSWNAEIVGTMTRPIQVAHDSAAAWLGIRFRPGGLYPLLKLPLQEFTDNTFEFRDPKLLERLQECGSLASQIRCLDQAMYEAFQSKNPPDRGIRAAIQRITASAGQIQIHGLCEELGVSRQYLARQFEKQVGISPKLFARVHRFRSLWDLTESERKCADWADIALKLGYYDQAHFISEFKEFAGATPERYFRIP